MKVSKSLGSDKILKEYALYIIGRVLDMEPELIQEFEKSLRNKFSTRIHNAISQLDNYSKVLDKYVNRVNLSEDERKEFTRNVNGIKAAQKSLKSVVNDTQRDIDKMVKNVVANSYRRDIAEINQFRMNTIREPKTPKYVSSIGTTLIPSGGALFGAIYYTTQNVWAAILPFIILLTFGIILIIWSVRKVQEYDKEIKDIHNQLFMEPFIEHQEIHILPK